jgi:hypothetical protein
LSLLFCLLALARSSNTRLTRSMFSFSPLSMMLAMCFPCVSFTLLG